MANAVDKLLEDLLSSSDEEEEGAPNGNRRDQPAAAPPAASLVPPAETPPAAFEEQQQAAEPAAQPTAAAADGAAGAQPDAGLDVLVAEPPQQLAQPAAGPLPAGFDLLSDDLLQLGGGPATGLAAADTPAAAPQEQLAFAGGGFADLLSLDQGLAPAAEPAPLPAPPASLPAAGQPEWDLLGAPAAAAGEPASSSQAAAGAEGLLSAVGSVQQAVGEGEQLSGGLSDVEDGGGEEVQLWQAAEAAGIAAGGVAQQQPAAAAAVDVQQPAAEAAAEEVQQPAAAAAEEVQQPLLEEPLLPASLSGGLSDVSTETDAESDGGFQAAAAAGLEADGGVASQQGAAGQPEQQPEQQEQQQQGELAEAGDASASLLPAAQQSPAADGSQPGAPEQSILERQLRPAPQQQPPDLPAAADGLDGEQAAVLLQAAGLEQPALELQPSGRSEQQVPSPGQEEQQARQQEQQQEQQQQEQQESLLQAAERLEARLAAGHAGPAGGAALGEQEKGQAEEGDASYQSDLLLASIISQLEPECAAAGDAAAGGGGEGAVLGRLAAARAFLLPNFEQLFRGPQAAGQPTAVAKYLGIAAVGTSSGAAFVLLPGAPASGGAGGKQAQGPHAPRLLEVGGERPSHGSQAAGGQQQPRGDAVSALCMGQHGGSVLLLVGHASGAVRVWELKTQLGGGVHFALTKSLAGMHAAPVTSTALLDGGSGTTWALTADAHGRLMCHNLSRHLSVAASAISSFARGLTGGGASGGPSHLIPLQQAAAGGASFDPGVVCALLPLHSGVGGGGAGLATSGQSQFAPDAAAALFVPEAGHFLLLVCSRAVLACLLTPEGRLQVLHVFLPPHHMPAGSSPYAAWRLATGPAAAQQGQQGQQAGGPVTAQLAVAWQYHMSVYRVVLLQPRWRPAGAQQQPQPPQPLPPPALLRSWSVAGTRTKPSGSSGSLAGSAEGGGGNGSEQASSSSEAGVCGCHFLDSGPLVVLSTQGETSTAVHLYRRDFLADSLASGQRGGSKADSGASRGGGAQDGGGSQGQGEQEEAVESLVLRDWVVGSQAVGSGAGGGGTFHQSASGFGDQLLTLNSQGVRVVQLLSWQQRLSALASQRRLASALLAAVRVYQAAAAAAAGSSAGQRPRCWQQGSSWPADGQAAQAGEVQRQLLTILCAYVDQRLAELGQQQAEGQGAEQPEAAQANGAAAEAPAAAAAAQLASTAIACCLLVRRPDSLWSDVFPRFQRHPAALPALLEQLLPAVQSDLLPSVAPEVMQALVEHCVAVGRPEAVERCVLKMDLLSLDLNQLIPLCIRHRLFAALIHIFTRALQDHFTPAALLLVAAAAAGEAEAEAEAGGGAEGGSFAEAGLSPEQLLAARESVRLGYKLLVFLRCCLLGLAYPPGSGHAPPEQRQRSKAQALAFLLCSTGLSVWECWRLWGEVAHSQAAAAVRELPLSIQDPHPALRYLCGLDAPAVLGLLRQGLDGWDALETDLAEMSPEVASQMSASGGGTRTVAQAVVDAVVSLLESGAFTAPSAHSSSLSGGQAAASRAAETAALHFLAVHLASNRAVVSGGVLLRVLQHLAAEPASAGGSGCGTGMPAEEREAVFCDVVSAAGGSMSAPDQQQAISLAQRAGFLQAEARVRHAQGRHADALACLARDARHPAAAFKYVRDVLGDPSAPQAQSDALAEAALGQAPQLLSLDAVAATHLVLDCFPSRQHQLLAQLEPHPAQQFAFLKSLVAIRQQELAAAAAAGSAAAGGSVAPRSSTSGPLKALGSSPQLAGLLGDMRVANLYVRLLCLHEPRSVLPYLQSHDSYGVDECLQHCLEQGVQDGAAFLLERRGDVHSALKIYIQSLDRANRQLAAAVTNGQLDLAGAALAAAAEPVGGAAGSLAGRARPAAAAAALMRARRPSLLQRGAGADSAAAGQAAALLGSSMPLPAELQAARDAESAAVAMCLRYSDDRVALQAATAAGALQPAPLPAGLSAAGLGSRAAVAADPLQQLWFQVLQCYVGLLRELRQQQQQLGEGGGGTAASAAAAGAVGGGPSLAERRWQLELLQEVMTGLMEEVITSMAGQVPLRSIADVIMQQYGGDRWGDFKGTLLGLLTACGAELSILKCAHRVVAADGTHVLAGGYRQCMQPAPLPVFASVGAGAGSSGAAPGPSSPAAAGWVQRGGEMLARTAAKAQTLLE